MPTARRPPRSPNRGRPDRPLDETAIGFVVNGTAMRLDSADDEVEAVRRMARAGVTQRAAADRLLISWDMAGRHAREAGVSFAPATPPAHWTYEYADGSKSGPRRRRR